MHLNSPVCRHCTSAESHKSFYRNCPQRQPPSLLVRVVIQVIGHWWDHHYRQAFLSTKVFCCNDQLIPQSYKLVETCLSLSKILNQAKVFVVIFVDHFEFYEELIGITFAPGKLSKFVCTFSKVYIVGTSQFVQECVSVVSHVWTRQNAGSWKKWYVFGKGSWGMTCAALCYLDTLFSVRVRCCFFIWSLSGDFFTKRFFSDLVTW